MNLFDFLSNLDSKIREEYFEFLLFDKTQVSDETIINKLVDLENDFYKGDIPSFCNDHNWHYDSNKYLLLDFSKFLSYYNSVSENIKTILKNGIYDFFSEECVDDGIFICGDINPFENLKKFLESHNIKYQWSEAFI